MKKAIWLLSVYFAFTFAHVPSADASVRGGSAYMFYGVDPGTGVRDCYEVIKNYDNATARNYIQSNLQYMYNTAGQRRLMVEVWHARGSASPQCTDPTARGNSLDSDTTNFEWQYITNLTDYVDYARTLGFQEIVVIMGPQASNDPKSWSSFTWGVNNLYYFENWYAIQQVRAALVAAQLPFKLILQDEPLLHTTGNYTAQRSYVHDLWQLYLQTYGTTQGRAEAGFTLGVGRYNNGVQPGTRSAGVQIADLIAEIDHVGLGRPNYWPFNVYGYVPATQYNDMYLGFIDANIALNSLSASQPVIVTASFYNDATSAQAIRAASTNTGRAITYLLQFPLTAAGGAWPVAVADFYNYIGQGF